jgi:hypothetical protein
MNPGAWRDQTVAELKGLWRSKGMIEAGPSREKDLGTGSSYFRLGVPNPLYNNSTGVMACLGMSGNNDPRQNADWDFHRRIIQSVPREKKPQEEPCCPSAR